MRTRSILILFSSSLALAACGEGSDGNDDAAGDTTGGEETGADEASATMTTATTSPTSATTATTASTDPDTGEEEESGEGSTGVPGGFEFDDSPPDEYSQLERMGMPAVATALITAKDDYNAAGPLDDVAGTFVPEIVEHLEGLHAALDDDLAGAGLTPCAVDTCVAQGAPLVVPDTLKIDLTGASGFPNGRRLADPVIDVTLAVILLDLGVHEAGVLAGLPLNPPANDRELSDEFPYLADPHE